MSIEEIKLENYVARTGGNSIKEILKVILNNIYALFLPVNGAGNNMNMADAKRFCKRINPDFAVPMHCDMFDEIDMNAFVYKDKIVPEIFKEVRFI